MSLSVETEDKAEMAVLVAWAVPGVPEALEAVPVRVPEASLWSTAAHQVAMAVPEALEVMAGVVLAEPADSLTESSQGE